MSERTRGAEKSVKRLHKPAEGETLRGMGEDSTRGHPRPADTDMSSESGWVTTAVAARAIQVSPRTIRRYIDQGKLEAKPQGEGVRREWLVSVDSLHALRTSRTTEEDVPESDRGGEVAESLADVFREMAARLESRTEEAAELRVRLELTERTQSTLEDERRQAFEELSEERRRRQEAERERDELRRQLETTSKTTPTERPQTVGREADRDDLRPSSSLLTKRPWWGGIALAVIVAVVVAVGFWLGYVLVASSSL
jgi:hypothetical protein